MSRLYSKAILTGPAQEVGVANEVFINYTLASICYQQNNWSSHGQSYCPVCDMPWGILKWRVLLGKLLKLEPRWLDSE